jgi:hypothetical protein
VGLFFKKFRILSVNQAGPKANGARDATTPHPSLGEARQSGRIFEAELSALEKECEVQSAAGSL